MNEGNKSALKVPLLILPDRGLQKQTEVNVVTLQKSGKSYMIPLLILPKSISTENSVSDGIACNRNEGSFSDISDTDSGLHREEEKRCLGKETDELIENVDDLDVKYWRTPLDR
jgi:hypothetical protein